MTRYNESGLILPPRLVVNGGTGRSTLTPYGLIMGDGTNALKQLGTGTTGQGPMGQGAGSDFVWTDSKSIGAFKQLSKQTIGASVSTVDFINLSSSYIIYKLVIDNYLPSTAGLLHFKFSANNGSTFLGGTNYGYSYVEPSATSGSIASQPQIVLTQSGNINATAGYANNFEILILRPFVTAAFNGMLWTAKWWTGGTTYNASFGQGNLTPSQTPNAFRILPSTGTIEPGTTFTLYGMLA